MNNNKSPQESLITELAFNLILDSEESEGFGFDMKSVDASGAESITFIDKSTILEFLQDANTKVSIKTQKLDDGYERSYLVANNPISNESIKIHGLKDHYIALLDTVFQANELWKKRKENPNTPLLSHELIKHTNITHQKYREGEVGIAEYRRFKGDEEYRMLFGEIPHEVHINSYIDGKYTKVTSLNLAKASEVNDKMTELIDWVNNTAFKEDRDLFHDIAEFHARFIKIHPFGDGNGRTARLLTNYLLIALGQSMVTIPIDEKEEYVLALDYANSENLQLSSQEIDKFSEYLMSKYPEKTNELKDFSAIDKERDDYNKYNHLAEFLRNHQVPFNAKSCVHQILNNYGMKNIDERINVGQLKAELTTLDSDRTKSKIYLSKN